MNDLVKDLPPWLGTAPAWGLLVLAVIAAIKTWPLVHKNLLDAKERRESRYSQRITELEQAVKTCQQECDDHKEALRVELRNLEEKRLGDRKQHLQDQISLVSILVKNIDNPLLDRVLQQLQSTQRSLPHELTGVIGDADKD
jgi:uncharacterized membrane protein (DUF106 family)